MNIKRMSSKEAKDALELWRENYPSMPTIDGDYELIRSQFQNFYEEAINETDQVERKKDYLIDVHFGLKMYKYLESIPEFTVRNAADADFWKYLSVAVAPDVVAQRWGKDNDAHYYARASRIWFRSLWWYIYLSWQGDIDTTKKLLECNYFSTDTILNMEERTGRNGTYVEAYRRIIYYYGEVGEARIQKRGKNSSDLFRDVMKLNTARMMIMDPTLLEGGVDQYARSLFEDLGVTFDVA